MMVPTSIAAKLLALTLASQPSWPYDSTLSDHNEVVPMAPVVLVVNRPVTEDSTPAQEPAAAKGLRKLFPGANQRDFDNPPQPRENPLLSLLRRHKVQPSDQMLATRCRYLLLNDAELQGSAIVIQADNGDIVLTGTVSSAHLKSRAELLARRTGDVRQVRNELRVEASLPTWYRYGAVTLTQPSQTEVRRMNEPGQTNVPAQQQQSTIPPASFVIPQPLALQPTVTPAATLETASQRAPVVVLGAPRMIDAGPGLPIVKTYQIRRVLESESIGERPRDSISVDARPEGIAWEPTVRSYPVRVAKATLTDGVESPRLQVTSGYLASPDEPQGSRAEYAQRENRRDLAVSQAISLTSGRPDVDRVFQTDPRARSLTYSLVKGRMEMNGLAGNPTEFYSLVDVLMKLPGVKYIAFGPDFRFAE